LNQGVASEESPAGTEDEPAVARKDLGKVLWIAGGLITGAEFFVRKGRARLNA